MLHSELLTLLNTGQAWAFVGSGPSVDAHAPTWGKLVEGVALLPEAAGVASDRAFLHAVSQRDFPLAFDYLINALGRATVVEFVEAAFPQTLRPGPMHGVLARLPFAGYITTNYDLLLERALLERGEPWITVGNRPDENRKVTGDSSQLVWHVHGAVGQDPLRSRLVLSQDDYDSAYRSGSELVEHLKALLLQRCLVFVGCGFQDFDMTALLRRVGGLLDPGRPAFGFVEKRGEAATELGRSIFLSKHNIDVIPYKVRGESHRQLTDMLEVYANLSVPRRIAGVATPTPPADLDPQTIGLLIYNELVLARGLSVPSDIRTALLESHILSRLAAGQLRRVDIVSDVSELATELGRRVAGALAPNEAEPLITEALSRLKKQDLITVRGDAVELTDAGRDLVRRKNLSVEVLADRFTASLKARALAWGAGESGRVTEAAEAFFRQCVERRAIGVAMAMSTGGPGQQEYHAVSLLQALPSFVDSMPDPDSARCLVEVVQGVLRAPETAETEYIGTALQAAFAIHLLGYDLDTFEARQLDLARAWFVLDSSTLIPLLAAGSSGSDSARQLAARIQKLGARMCTTRQLVAEASEHARWAQERVRLEGTETYLNLKAFTAATGRGGQRSNAFLEGFLRSVVEEGKNLSLSSYLRHSCGLEKLDRLGWVRDTTVIEALESHGVSVVSLDDLAAADPALVKRRDQYQADLMNRRIVADTFTRDLQVAAEAEAAVLVEEVRAGRVAVAGTEPVESRAYFVSMTRIIDEVAHPDVPIVMRPEAALQWLLTLHPANPEELASLTTGLLWELQERGHDIVDSQTLTLAFRPYLDASASRRDEELLRMKQFEESAYAGAVERFDVSELDLPVVLNGHLEQRVSDLEAQLASKPSQVSPLSEEERSELEKLRKRAAGRKRVQKRDLRIGRRKRPLDEDE